MITVILWYDHIITMPNEIAGIWRRPKTMISWLYLVNRYLATLGNAAFLTIGFLTLSDKVSLKFRRSNIHHWSPISFRSESKLCSYIYISAHTPVHLISCQVASLYGEMLLFANQFLICGRYGFIIYLWSITQDLQFYFLSVFTQYMPETNAFLSHSCSWELAWLEFLRCASFKAFWNN